MSASSTTLFLCTFFLFCYVLIASGLPVSSDKYNDSQQQKSDSHDGSGNGNAVLRSYGTHRNLRSIYGFGPRMLQISRSKIPIELDLLVDNENDGERAKRFDDYGHMRFGKRGGEEQFDDYGHMRFGR